MANWNYKQLLDDILETRTDEIQCDTALNLMAEITNPFLTEDESRQRYPQLWQHFHFCSRCTEEYRTLLTILQASKATISTIKVPPIPKQESWLTILLRKFGDTVKEIPVQHQLQGQLRGGEEKAYTKTIDGHTLNISVRPNDRIDHLFDLECNFSNETEVHPISLEGSPVSLFVATTGAFVQEGALDSNGDISMLQVPQATYKLLIQTSQRPFLFGQIEI